MTGDAAEHAVIYVRVSTEEQGSGYSLPTQVAACREFAEKQGYLVVGEFQETCSGEELDRPRLNELFEYVAGSIVGGGVQVVVVYDVDRLSRGGPAHHGIIQLRLEKLGARVEYVRGDYNSDSHEAMFSRLIRQTVAWYENMQRKERLLRGRHGMAKAGRVIAGSRPPYGYAYQAGSLAIVEELAIVVRFIFSCRLEGLSVAAIANRLTEEQVPTAADLRSNIPKQRKPGAWSTASVYHILCNRTYTGVWNYGKYRRVSVDGVKQLVRRDEADWVPISVPAIIDEATFEQAQAVSDRLRNDRKHEYNYQFLLRGRVYCTCGYSCRARHAPEQVSYYDCSGDGAAYKLKKCSLRFRAPAPVLDTLVWHALTEMLLDEQNLREAIKVQRKQAQIEHRPLIEQLEAAGASIAQVEQEMAEMVDLFLAGEYTREIIEEQKRLLVHKHKLLQNEEQRIRKRLAKAVISHEAEESLAEMARTIRARAESLPVADRLRVIEMLDVRVQAVARKQVLISCLLPLSSALPTSKEGEPGAKEEGVGRNSAFPLSCTLAIKAKAKARE